VSYKGVSLIATRNVVFVLYLCRNEFYAMLWLGGCLLIDLTYSIITFRRKPGYFV
jgi:hypothetical protein